MLPDLLVRRTINVLLRKKAAHNINIPHFPRCPSRSGPWRARNSGHIRNVGSNRQAADLHSILLPRWIKMERRLKVPSSVSE